MIPCHCLYEYFCQAPLASAQGVAHPLPASLQVARAPKPMWIDKAPLALLDHSGAHSHQGQRRHRQDEAQTLQGLGRPKPGRCQLQPIGCIIQQVLLTIKPKPILFHSLSRRGFVTDHLPVLVPSQRPRHGEMHRPKALCGEQDAMPEPRVPWHQGDSAPLTTPMPRSVEPKVRLDPDTKVPTQTLQMVHQRRISKATVGQQHHFAGTRHQRRSLLQQPLGLLRGHRGAGMLDDTPPQGTARPR